MNIKSILLGSAAALVAVSGARAADAVVMVEPEPVEYVRVCDVYGKGFFYIPGTETCLKLSGYVRMRLEASDDIANRDLDSDEDYRFRTRVRARLDFDAREETDLGTLRAKIRVQATNTGNGFETGDAAYVMDQGYIQLGGLTIGYLDSLWAGDDGGISDGLFTDADWSVGDRQQNRISYTYAANGFSGSLSLEDDGTGDFIPDVVGKLTYTGGWGGAYIAGVFDEEAYSASYPAGASFSSFGATTVLPILGIPVVASDAILAEGYAADESAFALKAGVMLKDLIAEDSAFKIEGHYAFDPTEYAVTEYVFTRSGIFGLSPIPSEWQIGAGYQQDFGKFFAAVSGVYGETFDLEYGSFDGIQFVGDTVDIDGGEYYGVAVNLGYEITKNFSVFGEVSYRDIDAGDDVQVDDFDQTAGFIEFKRTF